MKPIRPLAVAAMATGVLLVSGVTSANALAASDNPPKTDFPAESGVVAPLSAHPQYQGSSVAIPAGGFAFAHVDCPSGRVPTGGGGTTSSTLTFFTDSYPTSGGWTVGVKNTATFGASATAWVVCTVP
ncbi:hypothetical protein OG735_23900 [Streptomyces sp. NBC_01210]|uniref:hypothetical protein n=1 Tax=Streptomyces sp. NBC_01210 TaxID=2903774 RepID=UPI002E129657|nr:hypothetical protein OG735_23900 [Streptomyces sp. NBC_01210]